MIVSKKNLTRSKHWWHLEQVTSYVYIGSFIPQGGISEKEINRRIMIAWITFTNTTILLSCRGVNLKTRLRAKTCFVWPTPLYGAETWTIAKSLFVQSWCLWDVDMSQSIGHIIDGSENQRGIIIENDWNRLTKVRQIATLCPLEATVANMDGITWSNYGRAW